MDTLKNFVLHPLLLLEHLLIILLPYRAEREETELSEQSEGPIRLEEFLKGKLVSEHLRPQMNWPHQKSLAIWSQLAGSNAEVDQQVSSEGV